MARFFRLGFDRQRKLLRLAKWSAFTQNSAANGSEITQQVCVLFIRLFVQSAEL